MTAPSGANLRPAQLGVGRGFARDAVIWLAVTVACSRVLGDLATHWIGQPWSLYSAIFVPLLLVASQRDGASRALLAPLAALAPLPPTSRARLMGFLCLLGGLLVVAVTIGGGMPRLARAALPAIVLGAALVIGRPTPAIALLALWVVPVPSALVDSAAAWLQPLWSALGASAEISPRGAASLLPLMAMCAGLGHYAGVCQGRRGTSLLGSIALWALLAVPLQALMWWAVWLGMELSWVDSLWPALAVGGVVLAEHSIRRQENLALTSSPPGKRLSPLGSNRRR